jgi:copper chaperone CopZ
MSSELTLPVTGMMCANCAATVERTLKKTDGVSDAVVNYASERATVHFDRVTWSTPRLKLASRRSPSRRESYGWGCSSAPLYSCSV